MNNKSHQLQDPFLNALRKDHQQVSIFLINGIKLQGQITAFDPYVIVLKNTISQMVYKHAISTISPSKPVHLNQEETMEDSESDYLYD